MRSRLLLTTAALSVALGVGGFAAAQQTTQQPDLPQNKQLNNNNNTRSTTGQAPSSAQQPAQTAPSSAGQPQNNATGVNQPSTTQQPSAQTNPPAQTNQPAAAQTNQPAAAQTNPPAQTNQPAAAQTNPPAQTNQPAAAQTAPANQPSTGAGSQTQQPAAAQQQPSQGAATNQQAGQAQPQVRVSASLPAAERTRLTREFTRVDVRPVSNVNFSVSVGAVVPGTVVLHPVPQTIVSIVPQYRGYEFFVVRDEIVIVEPRSHRVVDVIERSGGSRAQATTSERKLSLSSQQKEIIRKHYSSKRVTTGSAPRTRTKVIVGEEAPESVEIHSFPEEVYREVPAVRSYRYIEGDRGIYLVEPNSRRVIEEFD